MKENAFTSKLLRALKQHPALRDALIWKVSDRFAAGRPDVQIILNGVTTYFELKVAPNRCTKLQLYFICALRRAYIVTMLSDGTVFFGDGKANSPMMPFNDAVEQIAAWCQHV